MCLGEVAEDILFWGIMFYLTSWLFGPPHQRKYRKLDYVSPEYVIPRRGINTSAHPRLNAPIHASSHVLYVRPFML